MTKKRRAYLTRIVGDKVMMPTDLKRLYEHMLDVDGNEAGPRTAWCTH
jgi:hypothetical protein